MADVTYSVEVEYLSKGNLFAGLNSGAMTGKVRDLERSMSASVARVGESFAAGFTGATDTIVAAMGGVAALAGGAFVAGLGKTVKEGINFAGYVESSVNGLAATLSMLGNVPIDQGLKQANASVEHLRKAAAILPGEFKDALGAFSAIVPAGLNNGVDISRLEKLGAQSVAVAASLGIAQNVAGHELAALLEGRARSSMPLVSRLGIHATGWNKLDAKTRFAKVEDLFGRMDPAMQLFQHSWEGLTSTARDNARNVAKTFATPLFESIKGNLDRGLEWFGGHENEVHAFATRWGESLRWAFESAIEGAKHWTPIIIRFAENMGDHLSAAFRRVEPYAAKLASHAERFLSDPDAPSKLAHGAAMLGGARLGIGAANMLGPALGVELGPALLAVAPLAIAAGGAFHILTDETSYWHSTAMSAADDMRTRADSTWGHLSSSFERLEPLGIRIADVFGVTLVTSLETSVLMLEKASGWFDTVTAAFNKGMTDIEARVNAFTGLTAPWRTLNPDGPIDPGRAPFAPMSLHATNTLANEVDAMLGKTPKPPVHNVTVHGGINIKVEGSDDPMRVAVKVEDILRRKMLAASASRSNPNAVFSR